MNRISLLMVVVGLLGSATWAGEIIVAPQQGGASEARSASELRDRARAYQSETGSASIILPEAEGVLSPRSTGGEGRAHDNRSRARQTQGGRDSTEIEIVVPAEASTPRNKASELRSRAGGYAHGENRSHGKADDGIPTIVCKDVESTAGRIGDDLVSGGIIIIMRDGKPFKVRCQ